MQIKKVIILLLASTVIFSYKLPFSQQQRIYSGETLKEKSYKNFSFKVDDKEYNIDNSAKQSDDLLTYIMGNLFTNHKASLSSFQKKHGITNSKSYFRLYKEVMPVIVYGNDKKIENYNDNNFKPEIWLNQEESYPVKVIFKKDDKIIIAEFPEYNNQKFKYLFPTKVVITIGEEKKVYQLTFK